MKGKFELYFKGDYVKRIQKNPADFSLYVFDEDVEGRCPCCCNKIVYHAGEEVLIFGDKLCGECNKKVDIEA
ncbi:hypothetical protein LCGC14_1526500 [marine sediment metagenome]|uniref:Uncharacterized protein n=1 Tax=marine sediment metagenome TaxID=412755 RepID=A0A0F9IXF5_9ZZZZ